MTGGQVAISECFAFGECSASIHFDGSQYVTDYNTVRIFKANPISKFSGPTWENKYTITETTKVFAVIV